MNELRNRGLPKWPQMAVSGKSVTVDQAKEIIRRTDRFFTTFSRGNDFDYLVELYDKLSMPFDHHHDEPIAKKLINLGKDVNKHYEIRDKWLDRWEFIDTEYVRNAWISTAFIHGPNGWCWPDGTIQHTYTVGKWPNVQEIENDWNILAKEFPFLDLGVTLMDDEDGENGKPVVSMIVKDGSVTLVDPEFIDVHGDAVLREIPEIKFDAYASEENLYKYEKGISDEWINEWTERANKLFADFQQYRRVPENRY